MPAAVPLVVSAAAQFGAAAAFGSAFAIGTIGSAVVGIVGGLAGQLIAGALTPTPTAPDFTAQLTQPGAGRTQQVRQPITPHRVVFGRQKLSGPITFIHSMADDTGRADGYIYFVHVLAAHHVKAIGDIYLSDSLSNAAKYSGLVRIDEHLGASDQAADANMVAEIGGANWTTDHRGRGRAYIASRLKGSREAFPSGVPNISAIVDGNDEIYDPRTSATGFTNNVALCVAKWITAPWGLGRVWADLDEPSVIAAANVCDERVRVLSSTTTFAVVSESPLSDSIEFNASGARVLDWGDGVRVSSSGALPTGLAADTTYYVIPSTDGTLQLASSVANAFAGVAISMSTVGSGTLTMQYWDEARYKCTGAFTLDMQKQDVLEQLLSAMAGVAVPLGGKWFIHAGAPAAPTVTLTEDDLRGNYSYTPKRSQRDRINGVRAVFVNSDKSWQPGDAPPLEPTAAMLEEDEGEELYADIRLPFTSSARAAQRLMKIHRERNRRQGIVDFPAKLTAMRLAAWDGVYLNIERGDGTSVFTDEEFRVISWALAEDGLGIDIKLVENDVNVYAWDSSEELTLNAPQDVVLPDPTVIAAPSSITVTTPTTPTYTRLEAEIAEVLSIWSDGYDPEYRDDGAMDWTGYGRVGADQARIISVERSTPQDFRVRAVTKNGNTSAFTENLAPAAPSGEAAIGTDITWTNAADAATVQVFKNVASDFNGSTLFTTVNPGSTQTVSVDDNAYYWLRSVNSGGNVSAPTSAITVGAP